MEEAGATDGAASDAGASANPCSGGLLDGSYTVQTEDDVAAIATCTEITGSLNVTGDMLTTLSLPELTGIGGSLKITNTSALISVSLLALSEVAADFVVGDNVRLASVSLPALHDIAGALTVSSNAALTSFNLDTLSTARFVGVTNNSALTTLSLPLLETVSVLVVRENGALTSFSLESLTSIESDGFIVSKNPVLTTFELPKLTMVVGDIIVLDNPMLPSCELEMIFEQLLEAIPIEASGNDDSATCP